MFGSMDADIVVAGAGHNSLIAACYLAKAGYRCLVLDARPVPGGGSTTEEILLPGYGDRKSTRLNSSHIQKSRMPSSA